MSGPKLWGLTKCEGGGWGLLGDDGEVQRELADCNTVRWREADNATRRLKAIEDAPHERTCRIYGYLGGHDCDCWKAKALKC